MKTISFRSLFFTGMVLTIFFSSFSFASNPGAKKDKAFLKIKEAAENAGPHDWLTFATCAEKCIEKGTYMTEAYQWIEESLSINMNPYNLIILGDYYKASNLPFEAINAYVDSIRLGMSKNVNYKDPQTLEKIIQLRKVLYHTK